MKIWDKGFAIDKRIEEFTVGKDRELDLLLAPYDVLGSIAHCKMLNKIGLLTNDELTAILAALREIYQTILKGEFIIENEIEDVHSQVELLLTNKLGDIGKKIHSGRSRNDQVMLDIRLYIRQEINEIVSLCEGLFENLIELSNKHKDILMPGYTHTQVAMPSSFGLWFGAFAESLVDDVVLMLSAFRIANQNPLGSAAGYGSSFPLDRSMTTKLLGFGDMSYNVVYAQMGRGKVEKTLSFAMSSIASTLSKLANDVCLFMSQNLAFVSLPNELTTGSSIMPHKKNPDVFELLRAKANKLQALANEISLITNNLITGYHRDLQLVKESLFPAIEDLKNCISITNYMIGEIEVNRKILDSEIYKYLTSVESVNKEVLEGVPFRDAYQNIAAKIEDGSYRGENTITHTHEGSIGNLCNNEIVNKMADIKSQFMFHKYEQAMKSLI